MNAVHDLPVLIARERLLQGRGLDIAFVTTPGGALRQKMIPPGTAGTGLFVHTCWRRMRTLRAFSERLQGE